MPRTPPRNAHAGAVCIPLKPVPSPIAAVKQMRIKPPDKKEIAELKRGDSTASRNLKLIGPWIAMQKPAEIIRRISSKRIRYPGYKETE